MKKSFVKELKTAIQVALFKHKDMHNVAGDKHKTTYAFYIIIAVAAIGLIGQQFFMGPFTPAIWIGVSMAIMQIIMAIIGIYILSYIAKSIFKGQAKHDAFFRVMAYAMIVGALTIIPMLSIIVAFWQLILVYVILKVVHRLTTGGAIGTIIVGIIVMGLVMMILNPIFGKLGMASSYRSFKNIGGGEGVVDIVDENNFEINVPGATGGSVKMDDGKIIFEGADGKKMEITIPEVDE